MSEEDEKGNRFSLLEKMLPDDSNPGLFEAAHLNQKLTAVIIQRILEGQVPGTFNGDLGRW